MFYRIYSDLSKYVKSAMRLHASGEKMQFTLPNKVTEIMTSFIGTNLG